MGRILKGAKLIDGKWVVAVPQDPDVVPAELEEPEAPPEPQVDLEALIAEAQAEAEAIRKAAHQESERIRELARQEGFQQGYLEGDSEGRTQWHARVEALAGEAQALVEERKRWLKESEADVLRLALLAAERILHREARDRDALASLIHGAMELLADEAIVRIRVCPEDVAGLASALNLLDVEVKSDPSIGLGGVVVETPTGRLDGRFVTQFRELAAAVLMSDPEADPVMGPVVAELGEALESKVPAAKPTWKPV